MWLGGVKRIFRLALRVNLVKRIQRSFFVRRAKVRSKLRTWPVKNLRLWVWSCRRDPELGFQLVEGRKS